MIVSEHRDVDMCYQIANHDVVISHVNKFKIMAHTAVEEHGPENQSTLLR